MRILKYEFIKNNMYNIYLSNGEVITLNENTITNNELLLKKEITEDEYNYLILEDKIYQAYNKCIKYISIRLRSIKEIRDYLVKNKYSSLTIDEVINKLINNHYLDDNIFAKAYIKDKLNFTNKGDYKIKIELQGLGVSSDIIENNISNIDDEILYNKMRKIIDKMKNNKKYSSSELKSKIYNHLISSGYSKEKVIYILNEYNF